MSSMSSINKDSKNNSNRQYADYAIALKKNFFKFSMVLLVTGIIFAYYSFAGSNDNNTSEVAVASVNTVTKAQYTSKQMTEELREGAFEAEQTQEQLPQEQEQQEQEQQEQEQQEQEQEQVQQEQEQQEQQEQEQQEQLPQEQLPQEQQLQQEYLPQEQQLQHDLNNGSNNEEGMNGYDCEHFCNKKQQRRSKYGNDNLLDANNLLQLVTQEKVNMIQKLKLDYGEEYYRKLFTTTNEFGQTTTRGRSFIIGASSKTELTNPFPYEFSETDVSYTRLRRKLMLKIFQMQQKVIQEQQQQADCGDDCHYGPQHLLRRHLEPKQQKQQQQRRQLLESPNNNLNYVKYVFAAGGHSNAAAHGNFHHEQYSKVMGRAVKNAFESIGIDFQTRAYGMGGYDSAPELALCQESVFGNDIDALSWDFSMTDGHHPWKIYMYSQRAGRILQKHERYNFVDGTTVGGGNYYYPQSLTRFDFSVKGKLLYFDRIRVEQDMEQQGLASFYFNEDLYKRMIKEAIPETAGLTEEQIAAMPPNVRRFKCNGELEYGEPGCKDYKYNHTCYIRSQVKWHPGWYV